MEKRLLKIGQGIEKESGKEVLIKQKILKEEIFQFNISTKSLKKDPIHKVIYYCIRKL